MEISVHFSVVELYSHSVVCILVHCPDEPYEVEAEVLSVSSPGCCTRLEWFVNAMLPGGLTASFYFVTTAVTKMVTGALAVAIRVTCAIIVFDPVVLFVLGWSENRIKTVGRACPLRSTMVVH